MRAQISDLTPAALSCRILFSSGFRPQYKISEAFPSLAETGIAVHCTTSSITKNRLPSFANTPGLRRFVVSELITWEGRNINVGLQNDQRTIVGLYRFIFDNIVVLALFAERVANRFTCRRAEKRDIFERFRSKHNSLFVTFSPGDANLDAIKANIALLPRPSIPGFTRVRVIYLGTPEFAVPTLKRLIEEKDFEVVAAVCQPDRPKGRGNKIIPPPVKETALAHGIQVLQPEKLSKAQEIVQAMRDLNPDVIVMVAFGQILKEAVLKLPRLGVINLHGSLLPHYRGAAPINWAILNGDTKTGITTMQTEAGVDTGPMLLKAEVDIDENMTAMELAEKLSTIGAELIVKTLRGLEDGSVKPERQNDAEATFAPILTKEMAEIDWTKSAKQIHDQVRGLVPWPGTSTTFRGTVLKIVKTEIVKEEGSNSGAKAPGTILSDGKTVAIACGASGEERLKLLLVKPQGKGDIEARSWINGVHLVDSEKFEKATSNEPAAKN